MSNTILQKLVINSPLGKTLQVLQSRGIVVLDWRDGYITCQELIFTPRLQDSKTRKFLSMLVVPTSNASTALARVKWLQ